MKKSPLRTLISYFFSYKVEIIALIVCILFYAGYYLIMPILRKYLIDYGFVNTNINNIIKFVAIIFALDIGNYAVGIIKEFIRSNLSIKIEEKLYTQLYDKMLSAKISFFERRDVSELITSIQYDINNILRICDNGIFFVLIQCIMFFGGAIGLIIIDYKMAFIVFLIIPIKYIIVKFIGYKKRVVSERMLYDNERLYRWLGDTLSGIKDIKLFNLHKIKKIELSQNLNILLSDKKKANRLDGVNDITDIFIINCIEAVLYLVGGYLIFDELLTLGSLFAFVSYSTQVVDPISSVINIKYIFQGIMPSSIRYHKLLQEVYDEQENTGMTMINEIKKIEFKNVTFSYKNNQIFNNASFVINSKDRIAIMGNNGSGKSTVIKLLLGLREANGGEITINGTCINDINLQSYRSHIYSTSHESYIFLTSLENNISMYKEEKKIDYAEVSKFCKLDKIFEKYNIKTNSFSGDKLSTGERQKIFFARALAFKRYLYVFDESTSNLDQESRIILRDIIVDKLRDSIVICITHDENILDLMTKILYINKNGNIFMFTNRDDFISFKNKE